MWAKMELAFVEALERAALAAARIVPGLLVVVVVLLLFVLVAMAVRVGLARLLGRAGLDRRASNWGFAEVQESLPRGSLTLLVAMGIAAARFFEHVALIGAVNLHVQSARLLSVGVKWLVLVFAGALAFEHLGIGGMLVTVSFAILFGGVVLTLALAVGLGRATS